MFLDDVNLPPSRSQFWFVRRREREEEEEEQVRSMDNKPSEKLDIETLHETQEEKKSTQVGSMVGNHQLP
jgi:hypothetical protein